MKKLTFLIVLCLVYFSTEVFAGINISYTIIPGEYGGKSGNQIICIGTTGICYTIYTITITTSEGSNPGPNQKSANVYIPTEDKVITYVDDITTTIINDPVHGEASASTLLLAPNSSEMTWSEFQAMIEGLDD